MSFQSSNSSIQIICNAPDVDLLGYKVDETDPGVFTIQKPDGTTESIVVGPGVSESLTVLSYNPTTNTLSYTDEDSVTTNIALNSDVVTSISYNAATNQISYIDENGSTSIITLNSDVLTSLFYNTTTNQLIYSDEAGSVTTLDLNPDVLTTLTYNAASGDLVYIDEEGASTNINLALENFLSSVSYDPVANELSFDLVDGSSFSIDLTDLVDVETITTLVDNGDGTYTYTNESGSVTTVDTNNETITTLVDNNNGTFTYTNEDGVSTTISIDETITTLVDNGNGTFTYTSEDGTPTTINTNDIVTTLVDNADRTFTYTSEDGTVTTFDAGETVSTLVDNGDGTLTYTDEVGTATLIDTNDVVTVLSNNGDGTYTYTSEDGTTTTVDVNDIVTTLVDNGDGTFTYTSEDATITTVSTSGVETESTLVEILTSARYRYTSEFGNVTDIVLPTKAFGRLAANGNILSGFNFTSSKGPTGRYTINFGVPLSSPNYAVLLTTESQPGRDDYMISYNSTSVNGFSVEITEQDNGAAAGTFRDVPFSFSVLLL